MPRGLRLQTVDSELETLRQALLQALRMRNMQTGTYRLLREILAYIFECLQPKWEPRRERAGQDPSKKGHVFYSGWMGITHVCSFWREVSS